MAFLRMVMRNATAAVVVGAVAWAPGTALAYRTFADDPGVGVAARFPSAGITWELAADPLDPEADRIETAALRAFETWDATECSTLSVSYAGRTNQPARPGDGRNTITLVHSGWTD